MTHLLPIDERLDQALGTAAEALFSRMRADGSWQDHLPSSAVSTATSVVALHAADRWTWAPRIRDGVRWLVATQLADGGWGDAEGSAPTLNATVLAFAA